MIAKMTRRQFVIWSAAGGLTASFVPFQVALAAGKKSTRLKKSRLISSNKRYGAIWRWAGEGNPHGVEISLPSNVPSIVSDYVSEYNMHGHWRLHPERGRARGRHDAIDIIPHQSHRRSTPVIAAHQGVVAVSERDEDFGEWIRIKPPVGPVPEEIRQTVPKEYWDHYRDQRFPVGTEYWHLAKRFVREGNEVRRGEIIGTLGNTGKWGRAYHLHFAAVVGEYVNPHEHWYSSPSSPPVPTGGVFTIPIYKPGDEYPTVSGQTRVLTYPVPAKEDMPYYLKKMKALRRKG